jgi:hypothetical protein
VTFGLLSLESGKLLASFASEDVALDALQKILRDEPDAAGSVALVSFDEHGHPERAVQGDELRAALDAVTA